MRTSDLELYMKFQRQPRVIGTAAFYAPTNKLLIPPGIKRGDHVFICDHTESGDDIYVTVAPIKYQFHESDYKDDKESLKRRIEHLPLKVKVIWKDLAQ